MKRLLFVCSQNQLRSPTAEQIYASVPSLSVKSAGIDSGAETSLTEELIAWADLIFVMEEKHYRKLVTKFGAVVLPKTVICLGIPDHFDYVGPELIQLLHTKVDPYLGLSCGG